MTEFILSIAGALFTGGAVVKLIDVFFISKKDLATIKLDETEKLRQEAEAIRKELRGEIDYLKDKIKTIQKEVDDWREKYYKLLQEHTELSIKYQLLKQEQDRQNKTQLTEA